MSANILKFSVPRKKRPSAQHEKDAPIKKKKKKKNALVDTRLDLYLILRFLCVPLDEAHVPLVVRVPHFENHCPNWTMI